ncbi:molybdopterin-binding protein [Pelagibacteraceae bacterium]|nr:molybdopterin-binding protein [Pelagibacteraceae bacterium]
MNFSKEFTSAILIIGNEILSGRTVDKNTSFIAKWLGDLGISVEEVKIIPDKEDIIITSLNELRKKYQYVFTTGGIGPTHDDITSESVAKAFGKKYEYNKEAYAILEKYYANSDFNEGRKKMARMPEAASLIYNKQGSAPAFSIENVFVLPGIPSYVELMLPQLKDVLISGKKIISVSVDAKIRESSVAVDLSKIQDKYPNIDIGSYPYSKEGGFGTVLVMRGIDSAEINRCKEEVKEMVKKFASN